jgi:hypothetical protein
MGGGAGVSLHGRFGVATEKTVYRYHKNDLLAHQFLFSRGHRIHPLSSKL